MNEYRLTPGAQRDLSSIWDYTAEHWDVDQAETYVLEIKGAIERLAELPARGRAIDEIRAGYRRYAVGSHLVFFTARDGGIDVIRILHQRMDPGLHL